LDDVNYLRVAFLIFKILSSIQRDTNKNSPYWEILKCLNSEERWEHFYNTEANLSKPIGEMLREAISKTDTTLKIKMEL
jgi:hypothetical protein